MFAFLMPGSLHSRTTSPYHTVVGTVTTVFAAACFSVPIHSSAHGIQTVTFEHIYLEHGLSQSTAQCTFIDSRGLIWIGTQAGLNVYDGHSVLVFRADRKDSTTIPNDEIIVIDESPPGSMWIGTRGGLCRLDLETGRCEHSLPADTSDLNLPDEYITGLSVQNDTTLWIGTQNGLLSLDLPSKESRPYVLARHPHPTLSAGHISALHGDGTGTLWVGTGDGELYRLDEKGDLLQRFDMFNADQSRPKSEHLYSFVVTSDDEGRIITGLGSNGVFILDPDTGLISPLNGSLNAFLHDRTFLVTALCFDSGNRLWIGTFGGGLFRMASDQRSFQRFASHDGRCGPPSDYYFDLIRDASGLLLAGSLDRGLIRIKTHDMGFLIPGCRPGSGLSSGVVTAVFEEEDGTVWIGLMDGLDRIDSRDGTVQTYRTLSGPDGEIEIRNVCHLGYSDSGDIIVGGYPLGLIRIDPEEGTYRRAASTHMVGSVSRHATHGTWLAALNEGVYRIDPQSGTEIRYFDDLTGGSLTDVFVFEVLTDDNGTVWMGTNDGLYRLYPETRLLHRYRANPETGLRNHEILCLEMTDDGTLWIGTAGGLHRYDKEADIFIPYTAEDGLPSELIYSCESDLRNDLWLGTNNGLCRFDRSEKHFEVYGTADGIPNREFNQGASYRSDTGRLYFGTINGVVIFDPESVAVRSYDPPVLITSVTYAGRVRRFLAGWGSEEAHVLEPDNRDISVEYVGLDYQNPNGLRYACLLEGYDEDWRLTGSVPSATYTNLPPGDYTLRVKCSNTSGRWGRDNAELTFSISPKPWERPWFRLAFIAGCIGIISITFLFRIRSIQHQRDRLRREVQTRTRELAYLASVDALTEIANRRHFLQRASREFDFCRASNRHLCILMIDVDYFKRVNDVHGHTTGDRTLKSLADRLQDGTRREDIIGRLGGDEFAVLLISMDEQKGMTMAERLRRHVESMRLTSSAGQTFSISISIGVAELEEERKLDELVQRADAAMYQAKRRGRNRVVAASELML